MSPLIHTLGAITTGLALGAGCMVDIGLLYRWMTRRSSHSLPSHVQRLRNRPWRMSDACALACLIVAISLPALYGMLRPCSTPTPAPGMVSIVLEPLIVYTSIFAAVAVAIRHTRTGVATMLGIAPGMAMSAIRAGIVYGLACVPPVLLISWVIHALLSLCGISVAPQSAFYWIGDTSLPWPDRAFLLFAAIVLGPISEEGVFRAVLLPAALRGSRTFIALLGVNALFALIHFHAPSFLPLLVLGGCFSLGMLATGSILTPIIMHAIFNGEAVLLFFLFPGLA